MLRHRFRFLRGVVLRIQIATNQNRNLVPSGPQHLRVRQSSTMPSLKICAEGSRLLVLASFGQKMPLGRRGG
jgi:hypothetical protein